MHAQQHQIDPHDQTRIAVLAICDARTVRRAYAGRRVLSSTLVRLRRAALDLGLPPPPVQEREAV